MRYAEVRRRRQPAEEKRPEAPAEPRRRTGGRSARVVANVLGAALEVFAERGYAGLSFDEVASLAGVNKTTVYRRWPTKADLLRAALHHARDSDPAPPDLGSLRSDLVAILKHRAAKLSSPRGRNMARAFLVAADPELSALVADLRRERPAIPVAIFERAIARAELPPGTDTAFFSETLIGVVYARLLWRSEPIDDRQIERLVDLLLEGASSGGAVRAERPKPRAAATPSARSRSRSRKA